MRRDGPMPEAWNFYSSQDGKDAQDSIFIPFILSILAKKMAFTHFLPPDEPRCL